MYLPRLLFHPLYYEGIRPLFLYFLNTITYVNWIRTEVKDLISDVLVVFKVPFPYSHIILMEEFLL